MLPSKKIFVLLILLIIGIGALAWYKFGRESVISYTSTSDQGLLSVISQSGTSNAASQINGEGTYLDKNAPTKEQNDSSITTGGSTTTSPSDQKLTLTDTFARDFFTNYMNLQQSGVKVTSDNANQIASDYLKTAVLPSITVKQYTEADLSLTDSDQTHIKNYQNALATILAKDWPAGKTNEFTIMQQAFTNNNTEVLSNLTPIIAAYQKTFDETLSLSVPKLAASLHLNLINSLATYIQTLKMIQMAGTDPLSSLVGLNAYQNNYSNVWTSISNLHLYFINSLK